MLALWNTYVEWYELLRIWAQMLVDEHTARSCVRRALGEMLYLALNAYETLDGPYMHSVDLLYRQICMHQVNAGSEFIGWAYKTMPYPDEDLVRKIAALYSAVYEAGYQSQLTFHGRTEIGALVRLYDPQRMSLEQLNETLEINCPPTHPLRRALESMPEEPQVDTLGQAVALELWRGEEQRGMTWLKRQSIETGTTT